MCFANRALIDLVLREARGGWLICVGWLYFYNVIDVTSCADGAKADLKLYFKFIWTPKENLCMVLNSLQVITLFSFSGKVLSFRDAAQYDHSLCDIGSFENKMY